MKAIVYYTKIIEGSDISSDLIAGLIPPERDDRIKSCMNKMKKNILIAEELLLRYILLERNLLKKHQIICREYNEYGKSFFKNIPLELSISHSLNIVGCAVAEDREIGLDIQAVKNLPIDILRRFISDNEYKMILESGDKKNTSNLIWNQKEAFLKCLGVGWAKKITNYENNSKGIILNGVQYVIKQSRIDRNFNFAICMSEDDFEYQINYVEFQKLVGVVI
ncbi:4'-phosphopantetheinyl transferase family protein [Clostridium felsineum]|uniref:4'-phosphopantetheinyl transferase family protein n=1 Tax=Clostridium felsineum TaxID=36839 RepID=UPI00098C3197|nr:4'-phosphopantetheinyl transferase superfamily protein [Clostridium felsineum]URZ01688.1 4'-phosphopantetheinyl transferase Sfp [Clostridium felsineum]